MSRGRRVVAMTNVRSAIASSSVAKTRALSMTCTAPEEAARAFSLGHPSRGATSRRSVTPKFAMARAAVPIFSPSCGSTSTIAGGATMV